MKQTKQSKVSRKVLRKRLPNKTLKGGVITLHKQDVIKEFYTNGINGEVKTEFITDYLTTPYNKLKELIKITANKDDTNKRYAKLVIILYLCYTKDLEEINEKYFQDKSKKILDNFQKYVKVKIEPSVRTSIDNTIQFIKDNIKYAIGMKQPMIDEFNNFETQYNKFKNPVKGPDDKDMFHNLIVGLESLLSIKNINIDNINKLLLAIKDKIKTYAGSSFGISRNKDSKYYNEIYRAIHDKFPESKENDTPIGSKDTAPNNRTKKTNSLATNKTPKRSIKDRATNLLDQINKMSPDEKTALIEIMQKIKSILKI